MFADNTKCAEHVEVCIILGVDINSFRQLANSP